MGSRWATFGRWTSARNPADGRRSHRPARVLDQCGSDTRTGECHMRDSAGRGGDLDLVVLLDPLQSVPEPYASAEQDRDHHHVRVVDEAGRKELADHGRTSADAYMLAPGSLAACLDRLGGRRAEDA